MKKECDIVQDLLFGYVDNTLKLGSKELVEEHLKNCKKCKEIFEKLRENDENEDNIEIDGLKKVNKEMRNRKHIIVFLIIMFIFFVIFNVIVFVKYISDAGRIQVYLKDEISQEEMTEVEKIISNIDKDASICYVSKKIALEEFRTRMKYKDEESAKLLDGYSDENSPFPPYIIISSNLSKIDKIIEEVSQLDEVKKITSLKNINPYVYFVSTFLINN